MLQHQITPGCECILIGSFASKIGRIRILWNIAFRKLCNDNGNVSCHNDEKYISKPGFCSGFFRNGNTTKNKTINYTNKLNDITKQLKFIQDLH